MLLQPIVIADYSQNAPLLLSQTMLRNVVTIEDVLNSPMVGFKLQLRVGALALTRLDDVVQLMIRKLLPEG